MFTNFNRNYLPYYGNLSLHLQSKFNKIISVLQMKNQIKDLTDSNILRCWLDSLPRAEYNKHKAGLVVACAENRSKILNWIYGRCKVPNSAKKLINAYTLQVSGREIFTIAKPEGMTEGVSGRASGSAI